MMNSLDTITIAIGAVLALLYIPMLLLPARCRGWARRFPRSRVAGALLSAIGFAWAWWLLAQTPLGRFEWLRIPLYVLFPVLLVAVNLLNEELLAVRALGGLMILVPAPVLAAARWHPSAWRYVVIVTAYVLVIKGIVLILSPYLFRRGAERICRTDGSVRTWGSVGLAFSVFLLALGLAVF